MLVAGWWSWRLLMERFDPDRLWPLPVLDSDPDRLWPLPVLDSDPEIELSSEGMVPRTPGLCGIVGLTSCWVWNRFSDSELLSLAELLARECFDSDLGSDMSWNWEERSPRPRDFLRLAAPGVTYESWLCFSTKRPSTLFPWDWLLALEDTLSMTPPLWESSLLLFLLVVLAAVALFFLLELAQEPFRGIIPLLTYGASSFFSSFEYVDSAITSGVSWACSSCAIRVVLGAPCPFCRMYSWASSMFRMSCLVCSVFFMISCMHAKSSIRDEVESSNVETLSSSSRQR